jgi:antitoxin ParD1/3/4
MAQSLQVRLPEPIRQWVECQAQAAGYSSAGEYVRHVLETEQRRLARAAIDAQLQAGLESGPATPMTPADWQRIRHQGRTRLKGRRISS